MRIASLSRGLRAAALGLVTLASLAGSACGGGGSDTRSEGGMPERMPPSLRSG